MDKALPLVLIARQAIQVCDIELSSNRIDHRLRQARGIVQEASQKTHSGELQGKPQPVGLASLLRNELAGGGVQMEVAAKFISRWCSNKMAIAFTLRGSEETATSHAGKMS
jgi:hypothetical protein